MLENPKFESQEKIKKFWKESKKESWFPEEWKENYEIYQYICGVHPQNIIEKGIIETSDGDIPIGILEETNWDDLYDYWLHEENCAYGVADNIEQIKEYFKKQIEDPCEKFWINIGKIYQNLQPPHDGWRWHKWGPYIGKMNRQCEYLYNEDFSEEPTWEGYVYIFHCHKL